jgi:hypothetical protein
MAGEIVLLVATGIALVVGADLWLSPERRVRRTLRKARVSRIGDVREGLVKVVGKLELLETLTAPLSGRRCACYEVIVDKAEGGGDAEMPLIHEVATRDFLVMDDSGRARATVSPAAQMAVTKDAHWFSGDLNHGTPTLEALLARHGWSSTRLAFDRTLRYREGVLEPGEEVAVFGMAHRESEPDPSPSDPAWGYREAPSRLVIRGTARQPLLVSDDPSTLGSAEHPSKSRR